MTRFGDGIEPHRFRWIINGRLAVCERPGGCGEAHRRIRRREELVWIARHRFELVVVVDGNPGNLGDYDAHGIGYVHRPVRSGNAATALPEVFDLIAATPGPVIVHGDHVGDTVAGVVAGFLVWVGAVPSPPDAAHVVERLLGRRIGPDGIELLRTAIKE